MTSGRLSVKHTPLPWPGNPIIDSGRLEQLYCTEHVSRGKSGSTITYRLFAIDKAGKHTKLLSGMEHAQQVRFVEQQIEAWLGLEDLVVPGELGV